MPADRPSHASPQGDRKKPPSRWRDAASRLKREITVYRLVLKDPRTPWAARWLLAAAIGYALLPFDLIPDFIPVLGHLDDLVLIPTLVILAMKMIPRDVIQDCRAKVKADES